MTLDEASCATLVHTARVVGEWLETTEEAICGVKKRQCSVCGAKYFGGIEIGSRYCPDCGNIMKNSNDWDKIDVLPYAVYCKDCKYFRLHRKPGYNYDGWCMNEESVDDEVNEDASCPHGERREVEISPYIEESTNFYREEFKVVNGERREHEHSGTIGTLICELREIEEQIAQLAVKSEYEKLERRIAKRNEIIKELEGLR